MILKKQELLEFARRTAHIKNNGIMPILGYVMLAGNSIIKTNLQFYAKHTISADADPILIDEQILFALVNNTNEEEISVEREEGKVVLRAGKRKQEFGWVDVIDFPKFPEVGLEEKFTIGKPVIDSLLIASKFVDKKEANFRYVYSTENDVFGCDNFVMYFKQFENVPPLMLRAEACQIISLYEEVKFSSNGNIDFFECGDTIYGFVRSDTKPVGYYPMVKKIGTGGGLKLDKEMIQQFCNGASILSGEMDCICYLKEHENGIVLMYDNPGTGKTDTLPVECDKVCEIRDFKFNARNMLSLLNTPYDYIWFKFDTRRAVVYNEEDAGYVGFISETI